MASHFMSHTVRDEEPSHQAAVLRRMREPALQALCDVVLVVEGRRFSAHRAVLCGASEMLSNLLASEWRESQKREVEITSVSAAVFAAVLDFIYTGKVDVRASEAGLLDVDAAARLLLMGALQKKLRPVILRFISVHTVFAVGAHAYLYDDLKMQVECERFACLHFQEILGTPGFLTLPHECLEHFIMSNDLMLADGEVRILHAVSAWVQAQPRERAGHFAELLSMVRFSDMAAEELGAIIASAGLSSEIGARAAASLADVTAAQLAQSNDGEADRLDDEHVGNTVAAPAPAPALRRTRSRGLPAVGSEHGDVAGPRFRVPRHCVRNIRFDFVIRNIAHVGESAQSLDSPWYKCGGGLLWRLELYPRGSSATLGDYMSVFLRCCDESVAETFECSANFSLFIVEQVFGNQERIFEATKTFTADEPCWGRSKYVRRSELLDSARSLRDGMGNVVIGVSVTY
jgi:hypothetical protein